MNAHVIRPQSERGVALVIVLLMLAVLSGLATGFSMNGQTEAAMAANEVYYAGARAAAEAGLMRAVETITKNTVGNPGDPCSTAAIRRCNMLAGPDQLVSAVEADAVNADNGQTAFLFGVAGPYVIGAGNQYSYTIDILDDDDPQLYPLGAPTGAQLIAMGQGGPPEQGNRWINTNERLILRATGFGPKNTTIRIMRELFSDESITPAQANTLLSNPAILVNGDLEISGNMTVNGTHGNVHTNGDVGQHGNSANITGSLTATGAYDAHHNWEPGGEFGGGRDAINVPDIRAQNYLSIADFRLHDDGSITNGNGSACGKSCPTGWTFGGGKWDMGNTPTSATYYVEGSVTIQGNPGKKGAELAISIFAEGSISITGTPKLKPENSDKIQFVTNGDLTIAGNTDLDDPTNVDGQIFVREQLKISGNPEFQGRVMVQDAPSIFNDETANVISGNPTITYNGGLGDIVTLIEMPADITYVNNVRGWMEQ